MQKIFYTGWWHQETDFTILKKNILKPFYSVENILNFRAARFGQSFYRENASAHS